MAMVSQGWDVVISAVDSGLTETRRTYHLQSATAAAAVTDAGLVVAAFRNLSKCYVTGFAINEVFKNDDPTGPPAYPPTGGLLVSDEALITVNLTTIGKHASLSIPAPVDSMFAGTTGKPHNTVIDSTEVGAFLALFESGAKATLSDGEFALGTAPFAEGIRVSRGRRLNV